MTKFIRNNSKKLLAVFGVVLMIAFILPSGMKSGGMDASSRLVGHIGGDKVFDTDISRAKMQWDILERYVVISPEMTGGAVIPLVAAFSQEVPGSGPQVPWIKQLADQMSKHPEIFFLLQKEADRMGILVNAGQIDQTFERERWAVRLPTSDGTVVPLANVTDLQWAAEIRDAVAALMRVQMSLSRASTVVKISQPIRRQTLATTGQDISVRYVEFAAKVFTAKVPAPTTQELQQHFDRYAGIDPQSPSAINPHGFGYKYPNRVTLQYIAVPRDQVRKAIRATRDEYTWKKDAYKYYLKNQNQFPAPPTSQPTSQPKFGTDLSLVASTRPAGPTTKPFEQVQEEIVQTLMRPEIERKAREVQDRINTKLTLDWTAYNNAHPTAATAASTAPSDGYTSYEYLQKLALDTQALTGVLPTVAQVGKFSSAAELAVVPNIGQSLLKDTMWFPMYATNLSAAVLSTSNPVDSTALHLYQPSQILKDGTNSTYIFRLTGVKPAASPASINEVAEQVEKDWRMAKGYELAKAEAQKLIELAKKGTPLDSSAASAGMKAVTTGLFGRVSPSTIENVALSPEGTAEFRNEAFKLLQTAATQPSTPITMLELPTELRVYAAELLSVKPQWQSNQLAIAESIAERQFSETFGRDIRNRWLTFDSVARRIGWTDDSHSAKSPDAGG